MNTIIKKRKTLTLIVLSLFVILAGCSDEKADYINLSYNSFTFSPGGTEEVTIEVNASQSWSVEYEGRWITENEKNNNSITLGALPTQSGLERTTRAVFRSGDAVEYVNLSQLGTNVSFVQLEPSSPVTMLSPNGKYLGGLDTKLENNKYEFVPFIINMETGVRTEKPTLTDSHVASCITDDGVLIIVEEQTNTGKYYNGNELIDVKAPDDMKGASVTGTSSDGKIWVGYAQSNADRRYYPVKWENKEPIVLEIPEKTLVGTTVDVGAYARGCSADGSIIYGGLADDQSAVYWKEGEAVEYLGRDKIKVHTVVVNHTGQDIAFAVANRPLFYAEHTNMSPNGRYLATTFLEITAPNKYEVASYYPAYFDFETNTLTYITDFPPGFTDGAGITISNEGVLSFGCPAVGYTDAFVYDIHSKSTQTSPEYVKEEYGVTVSNSSLITRIANDSKILTGMSILSLGVSYQYWYLNVEE